MSKDIKKLLADIQVLAIEVTTKTKHDVFTRYAGHVNTIVVNIHYGGWSSGDDGQDILELSLGLENEQFKKLKRCKRELQKILKEV